MAKSIIGLAAIVLLALGGSPARAAGSVVVYCGVNEAWCRAASTAFEQKTGIHVDMTRQSAGEIFARLRAESANPKGDVWFGGTGDPHLQAASDNLLAEYQSPQLGDLHEWAQNQAKRSGYRTVGLYMGALGYGYNADDLAKRKIAAPSCWADLLKPAFKGEVQMADPNASGTTWTMLATLVQLMGEDQAFDYLKQLSKNIDHYTSAGAAPAQAVGRGEVAVGIAFQHDVVDAAQKAKFVRVVSPCEGTGYEIGSLSIIKGARHPEEAKQFYDWALSPEAELLAAKEWFLPGVVQQGRPAATRGAGPQQDEADRLRLRQIRLGRRTHPAALPLDPRGQERRLIPAVTGRCCVVRFRPR